MCLSSIMSCWSFISTMSNGKSSAQLILARYEQTTPKPNFPLLMNFKQPSEFRQSSPNIASKCLLNISCAVSCSSPFITLQILSSFMPSWMVCGKLFESMVISLVRTLIPVIVGIVVESQNTVNQGGRGHVGTNPADKGSLYIYMKGPLQWEMEYTLLLEGNASLPFEWQQNDDMVRFNTPC
jgi:hypothetical protein